MSLKLIFCSNRFPLNGVSKRAASQELGGQGISRPQLPAETIGLLPVKVAADWESYHP